MSVPAILLSDVKGHLRVDGDDEDDLIQVYSAAAADYVTAYCGAALLTTSETIDDEVVITLFPAVRQAMLLLIGDWYRNRGNSVDRPQAEMPHGVAALLANYRSYGD